MLAPPRIRTRIGLAALLLATACGGPNRTGEQPGIEAVTYVGVQAPSATGFAAAVLEGHFAAQDLTFEPTWATSGSVILQGVVAGSFNVGNVGPAQLYEAIKNGACARMLRPTQGAAYGLISQPGLHLDHTQPYPAVLRQLKGRSIGVAARGAAQELVMRKLLADAGLDPDADVTWVAISIGPAATTAFATDQVDIAVSGSQIEVDLEASGVPFDRLLDLSGSSSPLGSFWQAVAVANCGWADAHHDLVLKLCHALNEGFAALAKDPEAGPKAFAYVKLGSDLRQSTDLWARFKDPVLEIPALNQENWTYQARFSPSSYSPDFRTYVVSGCSTA